MTARLPQRRRDDDYLATLRCETAAVLYHAMKGVPATVALRRAVNARPAPEPKPVARVRMVRT